MRWWKSLLILLGLLIVCEGVGVMGSFFIDPLDPWYYDLAKPAWTPPSWLLGPVWGGLYAMMAVSAWLVWEHGPKAGRTPEAFLAFSVQLLLNAAWTPVFFGLQSPIGGLFVIVPMWAMIAATIMFFRRISVLAAWLLGPYLAWVSFAAVLNFELWRLNG